MAQCPLSGSRIIKRQRAVSYPDLIESRATTFTTCCGVQGGPGIDIRAIGDGESLHYVIMVRRYGVLMDQHSDYVN